jgi:hypothetical protein
MKKYSAQFEALTQAAALSARMNQMNVTQAFLAAYIAISQGELSKVLAGVRATDSDRVRQITTALDDIEWMLTLLNPLRPPMGTEDGWRVKNFINALRDYREAVTQRAIQEMWAAAEAA